MTTPPVAATGRVALAVALIGIGAGTGAAAEPVVYRFETGPARIVIAPPEGSVSARAAALPRLSGRFGFDTAARRAAGADDPGRVSFGVYDTGFITVDGLDLGAIPGAPGIRVTDGVPRTDDPKLTISDEWSLGTNAVAPGTLVEALVLRLRYADADRLRNVDLPDALDPADLADMSLTFTTRIDLAGSRAEGPVAAAGLLGHVRFEITLLDRVD